MGGQVSCIKRPTTALPAHSKGAMVNKKTSNNFKTNPFEFLQWRLLLQTGALSLGHSKRFDSIGRGY
jgi:hypothetical protein